MHRQRAIRSNLYDWCEAPSWWLSSKKAGRLLRIIAAPVIELGRTRVTMAGRFLHVFELRPVFECGGDECRPHRMRRVAAIEPQRERIFPHHAIDRVRVHMPALRVLLAIVPSRPE